MNKERTPTSGKEQGGERKLRLCSVCDETSQRGHVERTIFVGVQQIKRWKSILKIRKKHAIELAKRKGSKQNPPESNLSGAEQPLEEDTKTYKEGFDALKHHGQAQRVLMCRVLLYEQTKDAHLENKASGFPYQEGWLPRLLSPLWIHALELSSTESSCRDTIFFALLVLNHQLSLELPRLWSETAECF